MQRYKIFISQGKKRQTGASNLAELRLQPQAEHRILSSLQITPHAVHIGGIVNILAGKEKLFFLQNLKVEENHGHERECDVEGIGEREAESDVGEVKADECRVAAYFIYSAGHKFRLFLG